MSAVSEPDYDGESIPLNKRRGPLTMGLLWITMVTSFPSVLIGFQWFKDGLTLSQTIGCSLLGCLILMIYSVPAAYLGAKSGQTYGMLSRQVFGRWGSYLVSFNLIWMFIACYSLWAVLLAGGLNGLLNLRMPMMEFAAVLAILMACNNFFGFTGISNFARYLAAPLLIAMVGYTFFKVLPTCPSTAIAAVPKIPIETAITSVTGLVVGFAVWGNEADYWRYGKPGRWLAALPLAAALCLGQVIFPATGWMVARMSGVTEFGAATAYINSYSFNGNPIIAAIVLVVVYCAANDSNLYGVINAVENVKRYPHQLVCAALAVVCAIFSALLAKAGMTEALESLASLNCVFLPTVTVILIIEFLVMRRLFSVASDFSVVPALSDLPSLQWPGFIALIVGLVVGLATAGVIPGTASLHVGLCSVQAWIAASVTYIPLRFLELKKLETA